MQEELEQALGYTFRDKTLLKTALTHSSYANERHLPVCNERLEFLGDAILGFVSAEHIFRTLADRPEGHLTRLRADLVCEKHLAQVAERLHLGSHLLLGHGEERSGGRTRASVTSDAMEAVLAAVYLDGGLQAVTEMIHRLILSDMTQYDSREKDYKTHLQELTQEQCGKIPSYRLVESSGPDHDKRFLVEASLNGEVIGSGIGRSKKQAEQAAAKQALEGRFSQFA